MRLTWKWAVPKAKKRNRRTTKKAHAFETDPRSKKLYSICGAWEGLTPRAEVEFVDFSAESGYKEVDYEDERRCMQCMDVIDRRRTSGAKAWSRARASYKTQG